MDKLLDEYIYLFIKAKKRLKEYSLTELVKVGDISIGTINKFSRANDIEEILSFRVNTIANIFSLIDSLDRKNNKKYNEKLISLLDKWFKKMNKNSLEIVKKAKNNKSSKILCNYKQIETLSEIKNTKNIKKCSFNIKTMLENYEKACIIFDVK